MCIRDSDVGVFTIPGIPGMRMVVFSVVLLLIILYRREGIMGMREITWDGIFGFFGRARRRLRGESRPDGEDGA